MLTVAPAPGMLPDGRRIYAIGDVHGCLDRLDALHAAVRADLRARPAASPLVVHLGDYIDRGPDSAGVVARLASGAPGLPMVNLMGNHEQTMLAALDGDRAAATDWLCNGGEAALASWGIAADATRDLWVSAVPSAQLIWLRSLRLWHREGSYLFVHAGVRPGIPVAEQSPEDLLRIRSAFLHSEMDFGAVIVHGHTPRSAPEVRANRIGIDTGAVYGGKLTCAVLEGRTVGFITA